MSDVRPVLDAASHPDSEAPAKRVKYESDAYLDATWSSAMAPQPANVRVWEPLLSHIGWWDGMWCQTGRPDTLIDRVERPLRGNGYRVLAKGANSALTVVLGPLRVFKSFTVPFGNWQCDDYQHTPATMEKIGEVKFKYTYTNNGASFKDRDPVSTQCTEWLRSVDAEIGDKFREAGFNAPYQNKAVDVSKKDATSMFVQTTWKLFHDVDKKDKEALALFRERKYKAMNVLFNKYCNKSLKKTQAPPMWRLNPEHANDPVQPRLLLVPDHQQHVWSRQDDVHFVRVRLSRIGGKDYQKLALDVDAILALGSGPGALAQNSHRENYCQVEKREEPTAEAMYTMKKQAQEADDTDAEIRKIKEANEEYYNNA